MQTIHALVLGAGVAGLASSLMLARAGHRVTLVERDMIEPLGGWSEAFAWSRGGIPHFHQPHGFLPRGRKLLREHLPDVYIKLLEAGAVELNFARRIPGEQRPEDADLVGVGARRELIEWALRHTVLEDRSIDVRSGVRVTGLVGERSGVPRIRGVQLNNDQEILGDLVVDALGRTSGVVGWLRSSGADVYVDSSDTEALYYSRFYRLRAGAHFPTEGPWLVSPSGSLGYAAFVTFVGDNGTFGVVLSIPTWDRELRFLQHVSAHAAACDSIRLLKPLVDPDFAEPITDVLPMGSLQNMLRHYTRAGEPVAAGVVSVADALCHTSPQFALGLSMSLAHPAALVRALAGDAENVTSVGRAYYASVMPEATERYALARDTDADRNRLWRGERLDFASRAGSRPLFMLIAAGATALRDADIFRKTFRRVGFLDRTSAFDDDVELQERVEQIFSEMLASGPPPAMGPSRAELLERVSPSRHSAPASA